MKKKGRSTDSALLRNQVNQDLLPFPHKRLFKDLDEIQNEKIPTVNVTARPLESDLFIWHANIKGPEGTLYEGGVFHLELRFPQSYPNHPPNIKLFTNIPHPNVFAGYICLDMIQQYDNVRREEGAGWTSAYSVQSVLTQLQSFLFEENLEQDKAKVEVQIKKAVKEANGFKCGTCKHGGKLSLWPTFNSKETSLADFETLDEENDIIRKELVCFHTKLNYTKNQLGLGLKISKIPRTGNIKEAQAYFDYISIKAYIKESLNLTSSNERITHWLPVYFGQGDNEQRFYHFLKKALSMIMTNSTKNWNPEFVLEVFPKLFITLAYHIMDEKKHPSIRIIRVLTHIHSLFLYCLKRNPELVKKISESLEKFQKDKNSRIKDNLPNLGAILAMLTVVDTHKFKDIQQQYFEEQLDRQVLWIIKAVPELNEDETSVEADKSRTSIVFKSQMTSFQILCFYKLFITEICDRRKNKLDFLKEYEFNLCKLTNKEENYFQSKIFEIQKKVVSFEQFFNYVGLQKRTEAETLKLLKQAIKNSQAKKYHGQFETMHELPPSEVQFKKLMINTPSTRKYIEVALVKEEKEEKIGETTQNKKQYKFTYKEHISKDEDWKEMCIERWSWIKQALSYDKELTSDDVSFKAIQYSKEGISKAEDRLTKIIEEKYRKSKINYHEPKVKIPEIDWKRLFLRLDLEDFLLHIDMHPDFPAFYEKLHICQQNNLNTILIPLIEIHKLKSNYYYITALLSKLTTLKYIEFSGLPQMNNNLNEKAAKCIKKGLVNFREAGGRFEIMSFYNITVNKDYSDCLFNYLTETDTLTSLRFAKTNMFAYGNTMKVLSNALSNIKDLQEIVLDNCQLNQEKCKTLADSLMRIKKLQIFTIRDINNLGQGISSIVYNLAFSPNLLLLDIGSINIGVQVNEITEAVVSLQKLLKISAGIEVLKIDRIANLNAYLSKQFWMSVGECKSLRVLDVNSSGDLSAKMREVGNAVAFNARKKGVLEYLNMTSCIANSSSINNLYWGMNISEYDEEQQYGDPNKLAKMIASNYPKVFYNNLKALQLNNCSNLNPNQFVLSNYNKLITKKEPEYVKLFCESPRLESVSLQSTGMQKNIADILVLALDQRRQSFTSKIKVLDLSKNNLNKDGIKALAEVLPHNHVLEVLDLSKNYIGVSGADQLAKSLAKNKSLKYLNIFNNKVGYDGAKSIADNLLSHHTTLQFLELGHNRIRDKGLQSLMDALMKNKQNKLKILGLRFNFITNKGILAMIQSITPHLKNPKEFPLEEIFIRNNLIEDEAIYKLKEIQDKQHNNLSIDLLEKIKYLENQKTCRSIWIHPITGINLQNLKRFFQVTSKCGIIIDIRVRNGRIYPNRTSGQNKFGFVEFADQMSVTKALHLASQRLAIVDGVKFRMYKAGSGTFVYSKKTAKQKKLQIARNLLPRLPYQDPLTMRLLRGPPVVTNLQAQIPPMMGNPLQAPGEYQFPRQERRARGRGGRGGRGRRQ